MAEVSSILTIDQSVRRLVGADPLVDCLTDLFLLRRIVSGRGQPLERVDEGGQRDPYEAEAMIVGAVNDLLVTGYHIIRRRLRVAKPRRPASPRPVRD